MLSRRTLVASVAASLAMPAFAERRASPTAALAELEARSGGRLGVAILDTANGRMTGHRADERFSMCSTFKLPLAAVILAEIDAGRMRADQWVRYRAEDLIAHAPVTRTNLSNGGMTVSALAEAAQTTSDGSAANLLIGLLGGPASFTAKMRALGDAASRIDRFEPVMNIVRPGDVHDTTTPRGMANGMRAYLVGRALRPASRARLIGWMVDTKTGVRRIRAGLPAGWRAGDKTGSSWNETETVDKINDVAIFWPPGRAPLIVTAYLDGPERSKAIRPEDEAILAEVGRFAAKL